MLKHVPTCSFLIYNLSKNPQKNHSLLAFAVSQVIVIGFTIVFLKGLLVITCFRYGLSSMHSPISSMQPWPFHLGMVGSDTHPDAPKKFNSCDFTTGPCSIASRGRPQRPHPVIQSSHPLLDHTQLQNRSTACPQRPIQRSHPPLDHIRRTAAPQQHHVVVHGVPFERSSHLQRPRAFRWTHTVAKQQLHSSSAWSSATFPAPGPHTAAEQ